MQKIKKIFISVLTLAIVFTTTQIVWADSNNNSSALDSSVEQSVSEILPAAEYRLSKTNYSYSGKECKPKVTVIDTAGNIINAMYYSVKYSNNKNPGTASVKLSFKAPYSGTKKLTFKIKLKTPSKPKLTQIKQKQLTVNLTESTGVSGYQIKYSTSSKFKNNKTIKLSKLKGLQYSISGLKNNTKYYVKVRSYKSVSGKYSYSDWSKVASKTVTSKAPQYDLPTEMLESYVLDSMEYVGYNVDRQKKNGTILQDRASGPRTPMKDRSGIRYGGVPSGLETVNDKTTATGKAPNLKKFRMYGMCCASYVTYYYLNYLPNIAGVDTSYIRKAIEKTGMDSQTCNAWAAAAKSLVKQGKATVIDKVSNGSSLSSADLEKLEIGDLITFSVPNQGVACGHVAVYAGTNNGEHFVAHVGSDEGPVFQTLERFENVVHEHDGCAYSTVYRFKNLPNSKYDYSVKLSKTKYKYTGKDIKPEVTVKDATGKKISKSNYTIYYTDNKKVGNAKVTVVFKGKYKGTKTAKFKITK